MNYERKDHDQNPNTDIPSVFEAPVSPLFSLAIENVPHTFEMEAIRELATVLQATSAAHTYGEILQNRENYHTLSQLTYDSERSSTEPNQEIPGLGAFIEMINDMETIVKNEKSTELEKLRASKAKKKAAMERVNKFYVQFYTRTHGLRIENSVPAGIYIEDAQDLDEKLSLAEIFFHDNVMRPINALEQSTNESPEIKDIAFNEAVNTFSGLVELTDNLVSQPETNRVEFWRDVIDEKLSSPFPEMMRKDGTALICTVQPTAEMEDIENKRLTLDKWTVRLLTQGITGNAVDADSHNLAVSFGLVKADDNRYLTITFKNDGRKLADAIEEKGTYTGDSIGEDKYHGGRGVWGPKMAKRLEKYKATISLRNNDDNEPGISVIVTIPIDGDTQPLSAEDEEVLKRFDSWS